jgi:hypothetical protein
MEGSTDTRAKMFVVRTYIHQRKGVWVNINHPDTPERMELLNKAYAIALAWYMSI